MLTLGPNYTALLILMRMSSVLHQSINLSFADLLVLFTNSFYKKILFLCVKESRRNYTFYLSVFLTPLSSSLMTSNNMDLIKPMDGSDSVFSRL